MSPFIDMDARYDFGILSPGKAVRLRIHESEKGEPLLAATFAGHRVNITSAALGGWLLKIPFMTWKIMAGIHWEALKLWLKGARFHKSPPASRSASYRDEAAAFEPGEVNSAVSYHGSAGGHRSRRIRRRSSRQAGGANGAD